MKNVSFLLRVFLSRSCVHMSGSPVALALFLLFINITSKQRELLSQNWSYFIMFIAKLHAFYMFRII